MDHENVKSLRHHALVCRGVSTRLRTREASLFSSLTRRPAGCMSAVNALDNFPQEASGRCRRDRQEDENHLTPRAMPIFVLSIPSDAPSLDGDYRFEAAPPALICEAVIDIRAC